MDAPLPPLADGHIVAIVLLGICLLVAIMVSLWKKECFAPIQKFAWYGRWNFWLSLAFLMGYTATYGCLTAWFVGATPIYLFKDKISSPVVTTDLGDSSIPLTQGCDTLWTCPIGCLGAKDKVECCVATAMLGAKNACNKAKRSIGPAPNGCDPTTNLLPGCWADTVTKSYVKKYRVTVVHTLVSVDDPSLMNTVTYESGHVYETAAAALAGFVPAQISGVWMYAYPDGTILRPTGPGHFFDKFTTTPEKHATHATSGRLGAIIAGSLTAGLLVATCVVGFLKTKRSITDMKLMKTVL